MKNYNRIFLQRTFKLENKYAPLLFKAIKQFRGEFIQTYKEHGHEYAVQRLQLAHINHDLTTIIAKLYNEAGLFGATLTYQELKELSGQKAGGFGRNQRWINAVAAFLKLHLIRFVSNITETMRDDILRILDKAVKEGISINAIVKELEREDMMRARARVIARTEIVRATNVGHSVSSSETPYELIKKWSAAHDDRTRHSHRYIDAHTVAEDGKFKVPIYKGEKIIGYDMMLYPGDATADPRNTINCRCRVIYMPKRDSAGNLIMRREATQATVIPMNTAPEYTPAQIAAALKAHIIITVD